MLGKDASKVQVNQFVDGKNVGDEKLVDVPGGADQGFNDYAFVWEKDRIRWYVNGKLVHEATDPAKLPSHPSKIYLSLWGSDTLSVVDGRIRRSRRSGCGRDRPRRLHRARRGLPVPGIGRLQARLAGTPIMNIKPVAAR